MRVLHALARRVLLIAAAAVALVAALVAVGSSSAGAPPAHAAKAGRPFTAKLSYAETNHGRQVGQATIGIEGHGTFSAKLSGGAALEAAVIALASGVPVTQIAKGGSYGLQRQIAANGVVTGTAVASFKAHGLGTVCISFSATPGRFLQGASFVPMSGSFKTLGGTGAASHWRGSVAFKQTGLSGMSIENFTASGSERAATGGAKGLSAACKRVAKLLPR
jgi:hypothetical protein